MDDAAQCWSGGNTLETVIFSCIHALGKSTSICNIANKTPVHERGNPLSML